MKTKQEVIQEAYGDYWDEVKDFISHDGWTRKSLIPFMYVKDIDFTNRLQRPKSLQGIENNNGWIKIEDQPVERWNCFDIVFTDKEEIHTYPTYCNFASIYETQKITHYLKINPPKKPIY